MPTEGTRAYMGKLRSGGDGGEEESCSPKPCLFRADVEKEGELSCPNMDRTPVSELVVND